MIYGNYILSFIYQFMFIADINFIKFYII